jgi:hypothetical protein
MEVKIDSASFSYLGGPSYVNEYGTFGAAQNRLVPSTVCGGRYSFTLQYNVNGCGLRIAREDEALNGEAEFGIAVKPWIDCNVSRSVSLIVPASIGSTMILGFKKVLIEHALTKEDVWYESMFTFRHRSGSLTL